MSQTENKHDAMALTMMASQIEEMLGPQDNKKLFELLRLTNFDVQAAIQWFLDNGPEAFDKLTPQPNVAANGTDGQTTSDKKTDVKTDVSSTNSGEGGTTSTTTTTTTTTTTGTSKDTSEVVHTDVMCNGCGQKPIKGVRFHCVECVEEFNLCLECEAKDVCTGPHTADHDMLRKKKATDNSGNSGGSSGDAGNTSPTIITFTPGPSQPLMHTRSQEDMEYIKKILAEEKRVMEENTKNDEMIAAKFAEEEARKRKLEAQRQEILTQQFLDQEKLERERKLQAKTYECAICLDDLTVDELYILDQCYHKFCLECVRDHVHENINTGRVNKIHCPQNGCTHDMTYAEIKQVAEPSEFEKYEKFLLEHTLKQDEDVRWCPKAGCGNAMIGDPRARNPMMRCNKCDYTFCFNCKEEWHADLNCAEYQEWKELNAHADDLYEEWAKKNTKVCPKCKANIQKNGGCNHMTCVSCKHEFCWLCFRNYKSGHFNDEGPCKGKQYT